VKRPSSLRIVWVAAVIVLIDQVTKLAVKGVPFLGIEGMPLHSSFPFIDDLIRITYVENPGIAFGISIPGMKIFFSLFSVIAAIAIFLYLRRNIERLGTWDRIALVLIMGGAIGNLIDRCFYGVLYGEQDLFYGYVVDFLDFGYKKNWWPIFNVADSAVSVGVSILAVRMLFKKPVVAPAPSQASNISEPLHDELHNHA
jgi:signal peptidase II